MDVVAAFGDEMKKEFLFESGLTYLNHAMLGGVPRVVQDYRFRYVSVRQFMCERVCMRVYICVCVL